MDNNKTSTLEFSKLDIPEPLLKSIADIGYEYCTPIQAESLPFALKGKDVAGQAQTGTGKTAAFLIATYAYLMRTPASSHRQINQPRAIIIAPTRELAIQIQKEAEVLGEFSDFKTLAVFGGSGYESQRKQLEAGVDLLIGTPGRVIDYFKQKIFNLKAIQVMVLDEADRMFDLGFLKDIRFLLRRMPDPEKRLNLLYSATLSFRVTELAYEHMNNPQEVIIQSEQVTATNVEELVYFPATEEKIPLLLGLLKGHDISRTIIFINTKRTAEDIQAYLKGNDYSSQVLSGDVPQNKRMRYLEQFTTGQLPILIATDVAARGLHIPEVSHVFNFDLPQDVEDYVHRIGRTARAGASGDAISFACEEYSFSLGDIEAYIGHKIEVGKVSSDLLVEPKPPIREPRKKRNFNNSSSKSKRPPNARSRNKSSQRPRNPTSKKT